MKKFPRCPGTLRQSGKSQFLSVAAARPAESASAICRRSTLNRRDHKVATMPAFHYAPPGKLMMPRFNRCSHTVAPRNGRIVSKLNTDHHSNPRFPLSTDFSRRETDVSSTSRLCKRPHFPTEFRKAGQRRRAGQRLPRNVLVCNFAGCLPPRGHHVGRPRMPERQTTRQALPNKSVAHPEWPTANHFPVRKIQCRFRRNQKSMMLVAKLRSRVEIHRRNHFSPRP